MKLCRSCTTLRVVALLATGWVGVHASVAAEVAPASSRLAREDAGTMPALLDTPMVHIPAGSYAPLLRTKDEPERVAVPAFQLDARPVTNAEFLEFVRAHPQWRRSRVRALFADRGYLRDWAGELELGAAAPADAPVVRVSWFAARAFAKAAGKRLPTTAEWERAAAAGFTTPEGANEPEFKRAQLDWLARPAPSPLPAAGAGRPNVFGAHDLHGLVWEWVEDFNTAMTTGESRADTGLERNLFCGAGAAGARDLTDYPAFMRIGFRSSLRANYAVPSLGFRCARDAGGAAEIEAASAGGSALGRSRIELPPEGGTTSARAEAAVFVRPTQNLP